jgi:hypothetical protein
MIMDEIFRLEPNVDLTKLQLTTEGAYSVTKRKDGDRIMNVMKHNISDLKTKTITDVTGCVGGDTINFAHYYKTVYSIELNKENFNALHNNVGLYKLQNVKLYNQDSTTFFNWRTDVLYIDPPWGGPEYKANQQLDLFMSTKRIDEWLQEILLRKNRPDYIFINLPFNYNYDRFTNLPNIDHIKPYRIRTYILVFILVHRFNPNRNVQNP